MSRWQCPSCGGGSPMLVKHAGNLVCPWCYERAFKNHDRPERFLQPVEADSA